MNTFINANTSTVKGINTYLKEIADNTKIKYTNLKDLRAKASKFFEVTAKVEQYLREVEDIASAIGYQKIWEAVNVYVENGRIDLANAEMDIETLALRVGEAIAESSKGVDVSLEDIRAYEATTWFKLE